MSRSLFGLPGAEELDSDIEGVVARLTEPGSYVIEEWSAHPPIYHLPTALDLGEFVAETTTETTEGFDEQVWDAVYSDDVKAVADAYLALVASKVTYRMAAEHVRTWRVTVDDGCEFGEPVLTWESPHCKKDA